MFKKGICKGLGPYSISREHFFKPYLRTARGKKSATHQLSFRKLKIFVFLACQGEKSGIGYKPDTILLLPLLLFVFQSPENSLQR